MKLFRVGVTQRPRYSWNVHSDEIVEVHNEIRPYAKIGFAGKRKDDQTPQGQISFFRTKLWAARIVERWEEDYGELDDPEERDRKGGHLWWWTPPADDDEVDG
jgi:hypothetical protein